MSYLPSYRLISKIAIYAIAIAILCFIPPASAVTQELQFETQQGYQVKASFSYDAPTEKIAERGAGQTKTVDSLKVRFYNPAGEAIASYDNIVDGVVRGDYFEFNYDPITKQIQGAIDLGGETAGEMYLKGDADGNLSLMQIEQSGDEIIIDRISNY